MVLLLCRGVLVSAPALLCYFVAPLVMAKISVGPYYVEVNCTVHDHLEAI
jgi:hypothetical protein